MGEILVVGRRRGIDGGGEEGGGILFPLHKQPYFSILEDLGKDHKNIVYKILNLVACKLKGEEKRH